MCMFVNANMYVCIYVCISVYALMCPCKYMYVCVYIHTNLFIYECFL